MSIPPSANSPVCRSPRTLEGKSFAPLLSDPDQPWKPAAFSQFPSPALREWAARPLSPAMRGTYFGPVIAEVEAKLKQEHGARYDAELFNQHLMGYSMRTDRYRYTAWLDRRNPMSEPLAEELYDHETDPHETVNIAKANPEIVKTLSAQLRAQFKKSSPRLFENSPAPSPHATEINLPRAPPFPCVCLAALRGKDVTLVDFEIRRRCKRRRPEARSSRSSRMKAARRCASQPAPATRGPA